MNVVQRRMAERCVELSKKSSGLALDIGCGSGISGEVLTDSGFEWIGVDISRDMLRLCSGNKVGCDVGDGLPFLPGTFDLVISVSCVQWLFHSYRKDQVPARRIRTFFRDLFSVLKSDGMCILQFYCKEKETKTLQGEALNAGFDGGLVIDSPGTKNERKFLVLECSKAGSRRHGKASVRKGIGNPSRDRRSKYSGRRRCKRK